jgi:hypothetical protein
MSIAAHFIHTCDVQRATAVKDALNADKKTWATLDTGVRCRRVTKAQRVADSATGEYPIVTSDLLLLPAQTDVRVGDRIANIVADGATDPGPFRIESVLPRRGKSQKHVSVQLEKVR